MLRPVYRWGFGLTGLALFGPGKLLDSLVGCELVVLHRRWDSDSSFRGHDEMIA